MFTHDGRQHLASETMDSNKAQTWQARVALEASIEVSDVLALCNDGKPERQEEGMPENHDWLGMIILTW